ncbi:bifunctional riboflavin kinase/FAD synthetase [bacterium]|nr:MAG: bifunctional riboflavin kinase/FAD synthetase [bacterium]
MLIIEDTDLKPGRFCSSAVTIGNFDGVHRGHRALLEKLVERAQKTGGPGIVITFDPHPLRVLNPSRCPPMLTDFDYKAELIGALGVDVLVRARFDRDFAAQTPEEFAAEVLGKKLGAAEVWVGPDFAFGNGREGDLGLLSKIGKKAGFAVHSFEPFLLDGERVSSTAVREAVGRSDFESAKRLLGRPYEIHGVVVKGRGRGKNLGFPTANLLPRQEAVPGNGVYAAWAFTCGKRLMAAVNIGPNPTFGDGGVNIEAYLLDFEGDLYGQPLSLVFVSQLRGEVAFGSVEALVSHIRADVARVRETLSALAEEN